MDQEEARRRCREGGTILFLDVPAGTEFGVDQKAWSTGPEFRGVKMIPPGLHLVRWRAGAAIPPTEEISGRDADRVEWAGSAAPPAGIMPWGSVWLWVSGGEIIVRQWFTSEEDFVALPEERCSAYQQGVKQWDFDRNLAPYDLASSSEWQSLTAHMNEETLRRCAPRLNRVRQQGAQEGAERIEKTLRRQAVEKGTGRGMVHDEEGLPHTPDTWLQCYRYSPIPSRWMPPLSPGETRDARAITHYHLDKSSLLQHLLDTQYGSWDAMVGEYEMTFLAFWLGESYDSFEQWKRMTVMLCSCESALSQRPGDWSEWIQVLELQMNVVPADFFVDVLSCQNFLVPALRSLLELLDDEDLPAPLPQQGHQLRHALAQHFAVGGAPLDLLSCDPHLAFDEDDEDAPVIVEL